MKQDAPMIEGNECVLLSGLMNGSPTLPVSADDFSSPSNRIIFQRVVKLKNRSLVAVTDALRRNRELTKIGGAGRVTEIATLPHDKESLKYALGEVLEASRQRQAAKIGEMLRRGDVTPAEATERLARLCSETGDHVYGGEVFGELSALARRFLPEMGENSPNTSPGYNQRAVYPEDSILADFMRVAREQVESADAFIIGSILPVCAALLGRRVFFQWGEQQIFPNCFNMLAGKPGDRKSSIIDLAEMLARRIVPESAFLPKSFSPEILFEEYSEGDGGRPDKLWIVDDANAVLTDWRKAAHGERTAPRFLELYDCKSISDHFRRNTDGKEGRRRNIPQTSTSVLFGATFNIACFQGQSIREGLARRFLYYIAENHGRLIVRPRRRDYSELDALAQGFRELENVSGEMNFSSRAALLWEQYQKANRYEKDQTDSLLDAKQSRLSSAPMQVLKLSMIFEAARSAKNATSLLFGPGAMWRGIIEERTLSDAIEHIKSCLEAAEFLDQIANRAEIAQRAEILLAHVRRDFLPHGEFVIVTRTDLTRRFCNNSGRRDSLKPDDLYLRLIPHLERQSEACRLPKKDRQEWFAFRAK